MNFDSAEILKPKAKIFGGVHLDHKKYTAESESVKMPTPKTVSIPLKQNIGRECESLVAAGDRVLIGTKIGDSGEAMSAPVYSSVSGTVKEIKQVDGINTVVIESDGEDKCESFSPVPVNSAQELISAARECGLVGLGGAGFPTHIKLKGTLGGNIDTLIVNGAECEPYITSDYRTCMENFDDVMEGVYRIKELLGLKQVIITIEANKPKAIEQLYKIASSDKDADNSVRIMRLKTAYPQGAEKMLIYTSTKRIVPFGKLPSDVGCLVMNVTSIAALNKYINTGAPLTHKCITVAGSAVAEPKNVIVPIGTAIKDILDFCGGADEETEKILYGGPMMGVAVKNAEAVITKQNNAVLAFKNTPEIKVTPCIRCGRCAAACPMNLMPAAVETAVNFGKTESFEKLNVNYCIECGCCSYICPAGRNLTQIMRTAKNALRRRNNAK